METRLRRTRIERDLSMSLLAKLAQLHYTNLSRYEVGWAVPSLPVAQRLATVLNTTPATLWPERYGTTEGAQ